MGQTPKVCIRNFIIFAHVFFFLRQKNRFVEYITRGSRLDNNKDTACSVILFLYCVHMCASMCMCVHMCGGWRATLSVVTQERFPPLR